MIGQLREVRAWVAGVFLIKAFSFTTFSGFLLGPRRVLFRFALFLPFSPGHRTRSVLFFYSGNVWRPAAQTLLFTGWARCQLIYERDPWAEFLKGGCQWGREEESSD